MDKTYKIYNTYEHNRGGYSTVRAYANGMLLDVIEVFNDEMVSCGIAAAEKHLQGKGYKKEEQINVIQ